MAHLSLPACLLLLLAGICFAEVITLRSQPNNHITDLSTSVRIRNAHDTYGTANSIDDPLDLLDIVLVASVDGNLHAINRTSGHALWTISSPTAGDTPSTLGPLVRTKHSEPLPDSSDDEDGQEIYVIEPQSGEIYVMATPDSPLQRLPLSMPQLVEMSPYSMSGEGGMKLFVGKKETSLLLIELETGVVKATINPNSECPWDPFEDFSRQDDDDLDLDELDGTKPSKANRNSAEVFIGRTDYHISIHTRPLNPASSRPPVQNLSFSTYGPNNQDHALQTIYRRTADDTYIQSLPNGKIMSFKTNLNSQDPDLAPNAHVIWSQGFTNPVVAVFDVIRSPTRPHPFVLLQPHIGLQDLLPNVDLVSAAKENRLPNLESAYIGLIEETGSLFAMSPDRYPLIVFSDSNFEDDYMREVGRSIDPPPGSFGFVNDRDFPVDVDSITRAMKRKRLKEMCKNGAKDKRCLTGVRRLESSRLSRLLDGAATVPYPPYHYNNAIPQSSDSNVLPGTGNASMTPPAGLPSPRVDNTPRDKMGKSPQALSAYALATLALLVTIIWFFKKHIHWRASTPVAASDNGDAALKTKLETSTADSPQSETAAIDTAAKASAENDITQPITDPVMSPPASMKKVSFGDDAKVVSVSGQDQDDIGDNGGDAEDSDGDAPATPGKRKGMRRRRGKKKKGAIAVNGADDVAENIKDLANNLEDEVPKLPDDGDFVHIVSPSAIVVSPPPTPTPAAPSLIVSDTILGFGSHGTVVFKGSLQGRAVAVKRLLQDFVTLALREVNILQESDDHPNVIRYYYQEAQANFLYIALELCPASLADVVERPDQFRDISIAFEPKKALRQITSGLRHLHALKIVHRDIKPQNILISSAKKGVGESAGHRMLISDFGLCKKLEIDQTSFLPTAHGAMAAGTVGWRAPEILRGEVKLDESGGEESQSSRGSIGLPPDGSTTGRPTRLTKSVDIFALGCLFYYVLSNGGHPFGDRYERESNIMKDTKSLDALDRFGEEGSDAADLICKMLSPEAYARPDTSTCLLHPYFWDPGKRLNFLQDASDRFEIMCRDPRDPMLIELETGAFHVVGNDWNARLDKWFIENLGKYRKYDGRSVQDLLRALRNKKHHYQDLPDNVKRQIGSMPEGFLSYFTRRFPRLFLHVHSVIAASSLRQESMFRTYFELTD